MSLVALRVASHPQQVRVRRGSRAKDERYTPRSLISRLHRRYGFTVDAASVPAAPSSEVIGRFWTRREDGLAQRWDGEVVWCNPPFSNVPAWVEKAWASRAVVVMLLPANRTEQPWWQRLVEPFRDRPRSVLKTEFLEKRITFGTPRRPEGGRWKSSVPFGCVLLIWQRPQRERQLRLVHPVGRGVGAAEQLEVFL